MLRAYPGPTHYEGDLLTLEINAGDFVEAREGSVTLQVDDQDPNKVTGEWRGNYLPVPFDTRGLTGGHQLSIWTEQDGGPHPELSHAVSPGVDLEFVPNGMTPYP